MDTHSAPAAARSPRRSRDEYWCHQCSAEITPLMVPDPLCPRCHCEFVEKIEETNDPRTFVEPAEGGDDEGTEGQEQLRLEDLLRLFQLVSGTSRSQEQQRQSRHQLSDMPNDFPGSDLSPLHPSTRQNSRATPGQSRGTATANRTTANSTASGVEDEDVEMEDPLQYDDDETPLEPQNAMTPLERLLERIGLELSLANDGGGGGGLFNMVGNPGDYVFSQGALDDVITQMMEMQGRQSGPVGAPDDVIDSIPHHPLTDEELDSKTECSVCKDEFTKEDNCLQLKCNHIFHQDCIKPWLKMNGTCPTCRFPLVPQRDQEDQARDEERNRQPSESSRRTLGSPPPTQQSGGMSNHDSSSFLD